jgi:hypothetical protein
MNIDLRVPRANGVTCGLGTTVAVLITLSVVGQVAKHYLGHPQLKGFVPIFYVDYESNVPTWYSSCAMLLAAGFLGLIAAAKTRTNDQFRFHWWALSAIFVLLSADEVAGIHEYPVDPLREAFGFSGLLFYPWVIIGALFLLLVASALLRMVWSLPRRTRNLFFLAAALHSGGALGVEMLSGLQADLYGEENFAYSMIVTVEELMEMQGVVVFVHALLDYIHRELGTVRLCVRQSAGIEC